MKLLLPDSLPLAPAVPEGVQTVRYDASAPVPDEHLDAEALVVWVDSVEDRDALIAAEPDTFFTTPHYDGQPPIVLVRLDAVDADEAAELITDSWRLRAPAKLRKQLDTD